MAEHHTYTRNQNIFQEFTFQIGLYFRSVYIFSNALPSTIPCSCQAQDPQECPSPFFEPSLYYQGFEQEFETFCTFPGGKKPQQPKNKEEKKKKRRGNNKIKNKDFF